MTEPVETVKKRRRWPWGLLVAVLLLIGGPLAWQLRPLNATEQRIVGTWRRLPSRQRTRETYLPNRRFVMTYYSVEGATETIEGSWHATDGVISVIRDEDTQWNWTRPHLPVMSWLGRHRRTRRWSVRQEADLLRMERNPPVELERVVD